MNSELTARRLPVQTLNSVSVKVADIVTPRLPLLLLQTISCRYQLVLMVTVAPPPRRLTGFPALWCWTPGRALLNRELWT